MLLGSTGLLWWVLSCVGIWWALACCVVVLVVLLFAYAYEFEIWGFVICLCDLCYFIVWVWKLVCFGGCTLGLIVLVALCFFLIFWMGWLLLFWVVVEYLVWCCCLLLCCFCVVLTWILFCWFGFDYIVGLLVASIVYFIYYTLFVCVTLCLVVSYLMRFVVAGLLGLVFCIGLVCFYLFAGCWFCVYDVSWLG